MWFKLWPKYQTEILDFTRARKYLIITDILNFFDSIPHTAVDRSLSLISVNQALRDLTLFTLEGFVQREAYAPLVLRGLPQIDLDAPRLLAHILLFQVDKYVYKRTRGAYARWVDDINFGVDSKREAREILRVIERFLQRIELRLNGPKTQILRQEAEDYLLVNENLKLTEYQKAIKGKTIPVDRLEGFYEDFLHFAGKGQQRGHWDQVYRRYVNLITSSLRLHQRRRKLMRLRQKIAEALMSGFEQYVDYRNRKAIIRYFQQRQMTNASLDFLLTQFYDVSATDDMIAFDLARTIANATLTSSHTKRLRKKLARTKRRVGGMLGVSMLLCKYGEVRRIEEFITATEADWSANEFLSRQVISLWSVLAPSSPVSLKLRNQISRSVSRSANDLI